MHKFFLSFFAIILCLACKARQESSESKSVGFEFTSSTIVLATYTNGEMEVITCSIQVREVIKLTDFSALKKSGVCESKKAMNFLTFWPLLSARLYNAEFDPKIWNKQQVWTILNADKIYTGADLSGSDKANALNLIKIAIGTALQWDDSWFEKSTGVYTAGGDKLVQNAEVLPGWDRNADGCLASEEPGKLGSPACFEGASCCTTGIYKGKWRCNEPGKQKDCPASPSQRNADGCFVTKEPGKYNNPTCFEGASCCKTGIFKGEWRCNKSAFNRDCPGQFDLATVLNSNDTSENNPDSWPKCGEIVPDGRWAALKTDDGKIHPYSGTNAVLYRGKKYCFWGTMTEDGYIFVSRYVAE